MVDHFKSASSKKSHYYFYYWLRCTQKLLHPGLQKWRQLGMPKKTMKIFKTFKFSSIWQFGRYLSKGLVCGTHSENSENWEKALPWRQLLLDKIKSAIYPVVLNMSWKFAANLGMGHSNFSGEIQNSGSAEYVYSNPLLNSDNQSPDQLAVECSFFENPILLGQSLFDALPCNNIRKVFLVYSQSLNLSIYQFQQTAYTHTCSKHCNMLNLKVVPCVLLVNLTTK